MFLIQIDHQASLGRSRPVQAVADGTHAEPANRNSFLLRIGNGPGKFENQPIGILRGFNRRNDRRTQSDFDAHLTAHSAAGNTSTLRISTGPPSASAGNTANTTSNHLR